MLDLEKAKALLSASEYTCVFVKESVIFVSKERGIKPLLEVLNADMGAGNAAVADKVVGKAAAFLYELMGIGALFAQTISSPALEILERAGILVEYENLVPCILNRTNTGNCPMETAVWEVNDARQARKILEEKVKGVKG